MFSVSLNVTFSCVSSDMEALAAHDDVFNLHWRLFRWKCELKCVLNVSLMFALMYSCAVVYFPLQHLKDRKQQNFLHDPYFLVTTLYISEWVYNQTVNIMIIIDYVLVQSWHSALNKLVVWMKWICTWNQPVIQQALLMGCVNKLYVMNKDVLWTKSNVFSSLFLSGSHSKLVEKTGKSFPPESVQSRQTFVTQSLFFPLSSLKRLNAAHLNIFYCRIVPANNQTSETNSFNSAGKYSSEKELESIAVESIFQCEM